uniref:Uncharacterized protein n=1 Tax=Rhizophora mucronata TaxID=61149 RepID=A0A2P2JKK5_RHIMU
MCAGLKQEDNLKKFAFSLFYLTGLAREESKVDRQNERLSYSHGFFIFSV